MEILLREGANLEHCNKSGCTPLSIAVSGGYMTLVKLLINSGAEINSR